MLNINENNTPVQETGSFEEYEYEFNFINMPWGDRTRKSKIGIILLMLAIFIATFACVINSYLMHYRRNDHNYKKLSGHSTQLNCLLVRVEDYRFVARIHSLNTHELICVGAVVSDKMVLANGACVKNSQVQIYVGSPTDIRCKNGFTVHAVESITHEGVIAKKMVLLITNQRMTRCAKVIEFGSDVIQESNRAFVIGRNPNGKAGRTVSRQPVIVVGFGTKCSCQGLPVKQQPNIICVKTLAHCPILAGDLLVQGGLLYGLASTSLYKLNQLDQVCFADLKATLKDVFDHLVD